ncbi:MAG: hypothetical protein CO150_03550 [Nitrospirae bacterium CG_4_9_14_3_um_filter_53_35]|nr:MAG: hypothetical protein AUK29_02660 [Nitrospirae bacterium CG2_30_53_67]PIS36794.1 MAG: hypothetical protein COT35_09350 [Nitrospirae bacterium CG08_land_8_20_14_0_20_52_24]PIX86970.1 MAG: hypothetical protein COZ32_00665 [Nitrospirae bacterium CG_4_10_14_3_um_filter_53_41]PJA76290.1 MAG: hypothetical protein CO150_03550 [Nitrospirae bacterium CG_4_9_14_3_um_filter_53_35]
MGKYFSKSVIPRLDRGIQTIKEWIVRLSLSSDPPIKLALRLDRRVRGQARSGDRTMTNICNPDVYP